MLGEGVKGVQGVVYHNFENKCHRIHATVATCVGESEVQTQQPLDTKLVTISKFS